MFTENFYSVRRPGDREPVILQPAGKGTQSQRQGQGGNSGCLAPKERGFNDLQQIASVPSVDYYEAAMTVMMEKWGDEK